MTSIQGYARAITGGGFKYHSPTPAVDNALLVRANRLVGRVEWESAIVPTDYRGQTISFIWLFAISRENVRRPFHLTAGRDIAIDFHNQCGTKTGVWSVKGNRNSVLTFDAFMADRNDDLMGIATLEMPTDEVEKGKSVHFTVTGDDAQSQEWYMTFQGEVREEIALYPTDCISEKNGAQYQSLSLNIFHPHPAATARVAIEGGPSLEAPLSIGMNTIGIEIPRLSVERTVTAKITIGTAAVVTRTVKVRPAREMTIYIVPHSHIDLGYTDLQSAIELKQLQNMKTAIGFARRTAAYPEGSRFVWNVEVAWAADQYVNRMSDADRKEFFEAVKNGWVALNGMYLNLLTGLSRPEELLRIFKFGTWLADTTGVPIDAAMISDIPGYTWGTVTAMAQSGIKYFSTAPNSFDRIGDILVQWENKPFYWTSESGSEKVLVWIPFKGYALSHGIKGLSDTFVREYMQQLVASQYPYDIAYLRWSGHGDNAAPEIEISEFAREWNSKYIFPKFIISSASTAFRAFEKKYGDRIPSVRGDWTPYWEDGAGSSAHETAMNRASSERLSQAEALWTMNDRTRYPTREFEDAWRNVLLYTEHTWGAWQSVSDPEHPMTKEQWAVKQSYALDADARSRQLLEKAAVSTADTTARQIDIYNTTSWTRTEVVTIPAELSLAGDRIVDMQNNPVPSQRLSDGTLAMIVREMPAYSCRRYTIESGRAYCDAPVAVRGTVLDNGIITVGVDAATGTITELRLKTDPVNFAHAKADSGLNGFLYLPGDKIADVRMDSHVRITVKENGPLVASLVIGSDAPSCNSLTREVRLASGCEQVDIINTIDKQRAPISPTPGDGAFAQKGGKESLNFSFPFNVTDGRVLLDIPLGVIEPEKDQMPGACKNWLT
ncbi:MAG TPA: glycoside hydrolase family 38 C-terminal domain-containing protein, partial [Bacteroidota bacterium]|nr:glycoside hydrolase family 38 C-terminal domain-containing protein [Bacteroidota bacterium]